MPSREQGHRSVSCRCVRILTSALKASPLKSISLSMRSGAPEQVADATEERWREIFAHLYEIVTLVDTQGRITYTTPSVKRSLGFEPCAITGDSVTEHNHPDDRLAVAGALVRCQEDGASVSLTHRVRAKDDTWRTFESRFVSLSRDPTVAAVLIASRDLTEQVALECDRERLELDRRVSQRLEAVGQLAAGIAHEINTPLQFVGDSVSFLREAVEELVRLTGLYRECLYTDAPIPVEQRRRAMRDAEEEADVEYLCERIPAAFERTSDGIARVRSIVLAMKRFSHASSAEAAPADLNEAIETTLAVCRNEYKYIADIALDLGELPPVVCHVSELNQVFLNLVLNAAQAIEEMVDGTDGRGTISISSWLAGDEALIEIADDGPGIPLELLDRIYEPFFTTKEVGKGTGQGLALARTTIERHSGSLECRSAPGEGTALTIRLPLNPRERATSPEA